MADTPQPEKLLVGLREAARLLDCSYWTLVSWKAQGKLRTVKLGALVDLLKSFGNRAFSMESALPRQHFIHDEAESVNVTARIRRLTFDLLRTHIGWRADHGSGLGGIGCGRAGNAKVHHLHSAFTVDEYVLRL